MSVLLLGRAGGTTDRAVKVLASLPAELRLIGGLAVMCRVGTPHRATVDLDAITRGLFEQHAAIAGLAMTSSGGGQYRFDGDLDLDVIDVAMSSAHELADQLCAAGDITDLELNVVAHTWAHDGAEPLDIVVVDESSGVPVSEAPARLVATAAGLVAMKVCTVPLRASNRAEKRASDLYDIGRLLETSSDLAPAFAAMPDLLSATIRERIHGWFVDDAGRDRTYREVRRFDEPRLDLDEVGEVIQDLL